MEKSKSTVQIVIVIFLVAIAILLYKAGNNMTPKDVDIKQVNSFAECVAQGNAVMESYPRQCRSGDKTFTEDIGNILEKQDLLRLYSPLPNLTVQNPLVVTGEARGYWYFEASFPIVLLDGNNNQIAMGIAQAKGEWMTEDFVPFEAVLTFEKPATPTGTLVLKKDNPSGLPENDDEVRIPINF